MDDRQELRKLPRGERCPECGSQKWYLQDGLRFCSRGHQIEGFIQFDFGDEEAMGRTGAVARRKKEVREVEKRQLTGQEGKTLYLEAVQLLLRQQVDFLVRKKGHKEELETVVRDLWDLRIRGYGASFQDNDLSESELETFSSQPTAARTEEVKPSWKSSSRAQSWDPERGIDWPLPKLPETIALCYLGCLLLKSPTRLADLLNWVSNGAMPYLKAYNELPVDMQKRMPTMYANALRLPWTMGLRGYDLYRSVMDTAISYKLNYEMTFPEMNYYPMLVQYTKELALPVEVLSITKRLIATLHYSFEYPAIKAKIFPFDHPELRLVAFLVVSTKLGFPFHHDQCSSLVSLRHVLPRINWGRWKTEYTENLAKYKSQILERPSFQDLTPETITNLEDDEFDAFMAYFKATIGKNTDNAITQFFPVEPDSTHQPFFPEVSEHEVEKEAHRVLSEAVVIDDNSTHEALRYEAFRAVQDLSETAGMFYKAVGDAAGVPVDMLVRAVYKLEQHIMRWQRKSAND
ncbi:hypothetical protein E4U43_000267 [Claviceps pusilla]|uniref:RRN7-type domain-containing protein n=1 Tax=Claviceps pusilla TaxID=123648 RepID=A0A9P7N9W7_9HYPO|nr:hypothetical protein E4U43_000267 [Claviceps pusilla]